MGVYELVRWAILEKQQVHADYKDYYMQMCPHVIGWKNGKAHALFYQFAGQSSSGNLPQWRCMDSDEVSNVSVVAGPWHTGQGQNQPQTCVDEIDAEVQV